MGRVRTAAVKSEEAARRSHGHRDVFVRNNCPPARIPQKSPSNSRLPCASAVKPADTLWRVKARTSIALRVMIGVRAWLVPTRAPHMIPGASRGRNSAAIDYEAAPSYQLSTHGGTCAEHRGPGSCGFVAGCRSGVLVRWLVSLEDLSGKPTKLATSIPGGVAALACSPPAQHGEGTCEVRSIAAQPPA